MSEERVGVRHIEADALKALAHPLRVRLYSELSTYGPATASALGARLGESSGTTSYHLRQLEKHGFVREDPERGNARDRWWERVPGPIEYTSVGAGEAGDIVELELARIEYERFTRFWMQRSVFGEDWQHAAQSSSVSLTLSADELRQLGTEVLALIDRYRGRDPEGRERIDLQFRAYPVRAPEDSP